MGTYPGLCRKKYELFQVRTSSAESSQRRLPQSRKRKGKGERAHEVITIQIQIEAQDKPEIQCSHAQKRCGLRQEQRPLRWWAVDIITSVNIDTWTINTPISVKSVDTKHANR